RFRTSLPNGRSMAGWTATRTGRQADPREAEMEQRVAAPRDLREWIERLEAIGQVQRVREEVDPDEEMGAITYMAHQTINAPALLFERIKGCAPGFQALWNPLGSSVDRFALSVGEPTGLAAMDLIQRCKTKFGRTIAPVT